ncbi:transglycosylase SLT domain-containing protein [Helicobacter sp. MIT 14-3879]|uniref:transglycosylase SLT domain-containing protein n=1 Tax=Helicobacter sp. MIT 14-3879 TaxID=2040649 RepID=UPI000E1E345B|nr:transglycosylase SLT domain-containing protein [Helicobacter sp. MIT 14-3879]RDU61851.1 hypothetical protein CQA44_07950 [Helicobacter sp. MIT 14-3879]
MKVFLILSVILKILFAYEVDSIIGEISKISGVDKKVYLSIIKIESNGKQNIIALNGSKDFYKQLQGLKYIDNSLEVKHFYPNRIVIYSNTNKNIIAAIAKELYLLNKNFDLGIAQINSSNFSYEEIPLMLDLKYNIIKANNILANCQAKYQSIKPSIECYNKGYANHKGYAYFKKFIKSYLGVK